MKSNATLRALGITEVHPLTTESQVKALQRPSTIRNVGRVNGVVERGAQCAYTMIDKDGEKSTLYPTGLIMSGGPVPSWRGPDAKFIDIKELR